MVDGSVPFAPLEPVVSFPPHKPRAEATTFVGRAAELGRLHELFGGVARVVTITGAPGIGKSRLAARYAHDASAAGRWPGGIAHVDLIDIDAGPSPFAAIARGLGLAVADEHAASFQPAPAMLDALARDGEERLLILEHPEHLIAELRPIVASLATSLHVLVTSRERLALSAEWCVTLGPLGLATLEDAPSEAVQLLLERGLALGFSPERACGRAQPRCDTLSALALVLDGNPLALELAATRLNLMTPCQLLERIERTDRRFELLASPTHAMGSLRAVIARSVALLTEPERLALLELSVFEGPFDLAATERVLSRPEGASSAIDLLDALVRKSLVTALPSPGPGRNFALHLAENERAFCRELLARDPSRLAAIAERHARWVAAELATTSPAELAPNMLQAVAWSLDPAVLSDASLTRAFELLVALQPALRARATLERALPLCDQALAHAERVPSALATAVRAMVAEALYLHGRGAEASTLLEHALEDLRADRDGDPLREALLVRSLGASHFYGRSDVLIEELERACSALDASDEPAAALDARMRLARAHENAGHVEEAINLYEQVLESARESGHRRRVALALLNLGALRAHLGLDATANYRAALAWARELGDPLLETVTLINLGIAAFERGQHADARAYFGEAVSVDSRLGVGRLEAVAHGHLALIAHLDGDLEHARRAYDEALAAWEHAWPDPLMWSLLMLGSALLAARMGDMVTAQHRIGRMALAHEREPGPEPAASTLLRLAELGVAPPAPSVPSVPGVPDVPTAPGTPSRLGERARELARPALSHTARLPRSGATMLRVALRLLGAEVSTPAVAVLAIARGGHRFVTPAGIAVELGRRGPARRILAALAERRVGGGRSVGVEELFALAWPGERIAPPYRANRVYVAIADLRKIGLEGVLLNDGDGYLLDPAIPVVLTDP